MNETITLVGSITYIKYQKENYVIADFESGVNGAVEKITIKGNMYGVNASELIKITGKQVFTQTYGFQIEVEYWERMIPTSKKQAIEFLSSSLIEGCGKVLAGRIVQTLGDNAVRIVYEQGSSSISGIKGISNDKALVIALSVKRSFEIQNFIKELEPYGIENKTLIKVYEVYKSDTLEVIKKNPYLLMDFDVRMNFSKADEIAKKIGLTVTSTPRIERAIVDVLTALCFEGGHCYIETQTVFKSTISLLNQQVKPNEMITMRELTDIATLIEETGKSFIVEEGLMYLPYLYKAEKKLSTKIAKMINQPNLQYIDQLKVSNALTKYQKKNGVIMALQQKHAIFEMFTNQMLIVTGQAGTGKTTVLRGMVEIYEEMNPTKEIMIAAPTGRARKRASEVTGRSALTIHKLLEIDPKTKIPAYNAKNPLPYDIVFVEEMSMVGLKLGTMLFDALKSDAQLIILGDSEQLPSVDVGNVLADLLQANVPHVRLKEVFRQAESSQIIKNAHRIIDGKHLLVDMRKDDFYFLVEENINKIQNYIVTSVIRFLSLGYSLQDIMVLSPQKKGVIGTIELNKVLQDTLNPKKETDLEMSYGDTAFRINDVIMNLENDDEKSLSNGDIGIVVAITGEEDKKTGRVKERLVCEFEGRQVIYEKNELSMLDLAYARTIHKAQGAESPIVIMPMSMMHKRSLVRNSLYTGLTRAKTTYVCVGTFEAANYAINNNREANRKTRLAKLISTKLFSKTMTKGEEII